MIIYRYFVKTAAIAGLFGLFAMTPQPTLGADKTKQPNIVLILADDMGIDSVQALNDENSIPTPNMDKLLEQGMNFPDAHSNSSVCSPTRYGVLTGRYAWRSSLKQRIVGRWKSSLIEEERFTLPDALNSVGYDTACIGKWHLGWEWPKKGGGTTTKKRFVDFTGKLSGGPMQAGFDYYYGDDVPGWEPFVWIENGTMLGVPEAQPSFSSLYKSNGGLGVEGFKVEEVLPIITKKSVEYINQHAKKENPFFLYFSLSTPHVPIAPSEAFQGKSGISLYADLLMETDWSVGQIMQALEDNGIADNTLLIFASDNGTSPKANFRELLTHGVDLQHHWRGWKGDGWEGGHRVPFIARWPGHIEPGSESDEIISTVDLMATFAEAASVQLPDTAAEDSVSLMPILKGEEFKSPIKEAVICHSMKGQFVVRKGKWKLQFSPGSGGWSPPQDQVARANGAPEWQLYDIYSDPKETNNLINAYPEVVGELTEILRGYVEKGRSTPGEPRENYNGEIWWEGLPWNQD